MSDRRAAVRREERERAKIMKNKTANGEMLRAAEQGKLDGRIIAFCVIANLLYDLHGFRKKRIEDFLTKCNKEATRFDQKGFKFVVTHYADKLIEKIERTKVSQTPKNIKEAVYLNQRDDFYLSSVALMLVVLNEDYGMASNEKNTGRLDVLMEYCTNEYIKMQFSIGTHSVDWYVNKTRGKTGIAI